MRSVGSKMIKFVNIQIWNSKVPVTFRFIFADFSINIEASNQFDPKFIFPNFHPIANFFRPLDLVKTLKFAHHTATLMPLWVRTVRYRVKLTYIQYFGLYKNKHGAMVQRKIWTGTKDYQPGNELFG